MSLRRLPFENLILVLPHRCGWLCDRALDDPFGVDLEDLPVGKSVFFVLALEDRPAFPMVDPRDPEVDVVTSNLESDDDRSRRIELVVGSLDQVAH